MDGHEEWGEVVWRDEAQPARPPFDLEFKKENLWFSRFDAANLTVKIDLGEVVWRDEAHSRAADLGDLSSSIRDLVDKFRRIHPELHPELPDRDDHARSDLSDVHRHEVVVLRAQLEEALAAHKSRERRRDVLCLVFWAIVLPFGALVWILGGLIVSAFLAAP